MDPVEQAKKLREEYERALDAAESRRAAYHEAVLELHRSGKPLREIATELGLSHQRVHQIVSAKAPRKRSLGRVAGGVGGLLILIAAISAFFWIRSYQPIAFAPAQSLSADSVNTVGEGGHGALVGYSTRSRQERSLRPSASLFSTASSEGRQPSSSPSQAG